MKFKLSKYIVPSIVSMVLVGTYTNIDGFFIGSVSGDDGLAAINIVWPIVAFITSPGTGIGVGGSVLMSALRGCGKTSDSEKVGAFCADGFWTYRKRGFVCDLQTACRFNGRARKCV